MIRAGPIFTFEAKINEKNGNEILVHYNQIFGLVDINTGYLGVFNEENVIDSYKYIDRSEGDIILSTPLATGKYKVKLMWENSSLVESPFYYSSRKR